MNIVEYAKTRYTTKAYDPTKKLSNEQIQQIKDILRFTPSSVNSQPWHFILETSDQAKAKIALEINATPMEGIEPHIIDTEFNLAEKGLKTSVIVTAGYSSEDDFNAKLPENFNWKCPIKNNS
ncbi:nitroreductase family protein [Francisella hispaniensis]|uniref:nitroreductase family protein n=1 Tax=Francisella hispaniensis TaxID=622488 RepID=UPI0019076531|nr:nitroreductase family protein [Francisella hispaniensis]MBK2356243.1 nitroreductase family protein [Francisella hispaniensis]